MYVRKPKNNFVKMSEKLTNIFITSKENTSVSEKQGIVVLRLTL